MTEHELMKLAALAIAAYTAHRLSDIKPRSLPKYDDEWRKQEETNFLERINGVNEDTGDLTLKQICRSIRIPLLVLTGIQSVITVVSFFQ